jgi:hypothetical protein
VGPLDVEKLTNLTQISEENRNLIKDGGHFIPPDCRPRERTAVIIPYRDRANNLAVCRDIYEFTHIINKK